jgi:hypothetical protein
LLGLSFSDDVDETVVVQALPSSDGQARRINADDVRKHVLDGVVDANLRFGTSYNVNQIQFVPTDSPPPDIYRALAEHVIERLAKKEPFVSRLGLPPD